MKLVRAGDVIELSAAIPDGSAGLRPQWLEGPSNADRLDVAVVTMSAGGATPPHVHIGGQVLVVTAGRGFVEVDGDRFELDVGDVVICPPGELHVHGAVDDRSFAHLSVTTGGYTFPEPPAGHD